MKCPKCGYVGFEDLDRCRNCGYDFSLTATTVAEVPGDLPLFEPPLSDDNPLITRPSPPRSPLAVRRATPEVVRARTPRLRTPLLDLEPPSFAVAPVPEAEGESEAVEPVEDAAIADRLAALAIDGLVLAGIDMAIVYLTLQICGIGLAEIGLLPRGPLLAFLLAQNGAYLVAFTAGGQTMGKMARGIKVVSTEPRESLDLGRALARELVWLLLAAPVGLGLLTTVFSRDRRGLHDRFAGTRVIRDV
ncbi:MAG: hypothetical protein A3G76_06655 [Acidobacteria bacterium RIFCSPLOWO2_12_FULL_65_11]|nr:MAG: hypothetical protein A3H95_07085 [Acidobacteria bacterium RIFCSPLOWO2_02_FULL_64_15]OFW33219.1 MAG: hypothetical protein A3G76_06655 [Acidobacteria bacterium RIFCSPLOWO2_12_FULL_65_11]